MTESIEASSVTRLIDATGDEINVFLHEDDFTGTDVNTQGVVLVNNEGGLSSTLTDVTERLEEVVRELKEMNLHLAIVSDTMMAGDTL